MPPPSHSRGFEHQGLPDDQKNPDTPGDRRNTPGPIPDSRHQVTPLRLCEHAIESTGEGTQDPQEISSGGHGGLGWTGGICDGTVVVTVCCAGEAGLGVR